MKTIFALLPAILVSITATTAAAQAPQGLRYGSFSGTEFTAQWDAVPGAEAYELSIGEYDTDMHQMYGEPLSVITTEGTSAIVDDLQPGLFYCFRLRTVMTDGFSEYSELKAVLELPVPGNVSASVESNVLTIAWSEVPGAHHYNIMVTDLRGSHPGLASIPQSDTYTTSGLSYDVAVNGYGFSSYVIGVSAVACDSEGEQIAQSDYAGASVTVSSASDIAADNASAEYYDLYGRRVAVPSSGTVCVKVQGGNATKVVAQ